MPNVFSQPIADAVESVLKFIIAMFSWMGAKARQMPQQFDVWLMENGFVSNQYGTVGPDYGAFRSRLVFTLALFSIFGILFQLYGVLVMGSAIYNGDLFMVLAFIGLVVFAGIWIVGVGYGLGRIAPGVAAVTIILSVMLMLMVVAAPLIQSWHFPALTAIDYDWRQWKFTTPGVDTGTVSGELFRESAVRGWVIIGMFISLGLLLPFVALGTASRRIIAVVYSATVHRERIAALNTRLNDPDRKVREEAATELKEVSAPRFNWLATWAAGIAIFTVLLVMFPNIWGVIAGGMVLAIVITILTIKQSFGIIGHGFPKILYGLAIALLVGTILYFLSVYIPLISYKVYPVGTLKILQIVLILLTAFAIFWWGWRTTTTQSEQADLRSGQVHIKPFVLESHGVDSHSGAPHLRQVGVVESHAANNKKEDHSKEAHHDAGHGGHGHGEEMNPWLKIALGVLIAVAIIWLIVLLMDPNWRITRTPSPGPAPTVIVQQVPVPAPQPSVTITTEERHSSEVKPEIRQLGPGHWQVTISQNAPFDTGIDVPAGRTVKFYGQTGMLETLKEPMLKVGPEGTGIGTCSDIGSEQVRHPGASCGALLAQIGDEDAFYIGSPVDAVSTGGGRLRLAPNLQRNVSGIIKPGSQFTLTIEIL